MLTGNTLHGFTVIRTRRVAELGATLYQLRHNRTGLEAVWLDRPEENMTFGIAFKTLPFDDTGVFHILEHSVLCGSESYPVKDPFVELMKTSMNTFLNALTFQDRTLYPVSSRNRTDFMNLTRVYLDAVFRPLIYSRPEIFSQEGWHYEYGEDGKLGRKGVVYNEMRGLFAEVDELEEVLALRALFPDSPYKYVSGGHPEAIPQLDYEGFIAAHRRYYSPSNAYVILDGALDIDAVLKLLDGEYLSRFERTERLPSAPAQPPVDGGSVCEEYELPEGEDEAGRCRLVWGRVAGPAGDRERLIAAQVLCAALCGDNQAPLSRALLSEGLAEAVTMSVSDGTAQPWLKLEVRNFEREALPRVRELLQSELERLASGLDRGRLSAAMANYEFQLRERDYGTWPQGLIFGFNILDSWMRDGAPEANLEVGRLFETLRYKQGQGYFEALLRELLLDNPHRCEVVMLPSHTAGERRRAQDRAALDAIDAAWNEAEREAVRAGQEKLLAFQSEEDSPEDAAKLPRLKLSDVSREPERIPTELDTLAGTELLRHELATGGINYLTLYFDVSGLTGPEISALSFLCRLLGKLGAAGRSAEEISRLIQERCGVLLFFTGAHTSCLDAGKYSLKLTAHMSALDSRLDEAAELLRDILTSTSFENEDEAHEILRQNKTTLFMTLCSAGHSTALGRVSARITPAGAADEFSGGLEYYRWLCAREAEWDWPRLRSELEGLLERVVSRKSLTLSLTGPRSAQADAAAERLIEALPEREATAGEGVRAFKPLREGIVIPSDVGYAALGASVPGYDSSRQLASRVVSLGWLWNAVRVQGGAYGVGMVARDSGFSGFYSYRDPSAERSLEAYAASPGFLKGFEGELDGFITGAVAALEPLLGPRLKGLTADGLYFRGSTKELRRERRQKLLSASREDLRRFADGLAAALGSASACVLASRATLEKCGLDEINSL